MTPEDTKRKIEKILKGANQEIAFTTKSPKEIYKEVIAQLYFLYQEGQREIERNWKAKGYVNATPDGNYALRLLQQAREDCHVEWSETSIGRGIDSKNPLIIELNRLNKERKKELDKAIVKLSKLKGGK